MSRFILKVANALVSAVVLVALVVAGLYSGYALWDNNQIYAAAENVQEDMIRLKPQVAEGEETGPSFAELLAVNEDVCAWVTVDETNIDYPVLQGEDNLSYINTDVYGDFALAGSIFLDSRNDRNFADNYSLLYGHHMANGSMFGDLDLFEEKKFFDQHHSGELLLPDRVYELDIFACMLVSASENKIFDPTRWQADIKGLLDFAEQESLFCRAEVVEQLRAEDAPQILALSTCSSDFTNARTIVLAVMKEKMPEIGEDVNDEEELP